MQTNIRYILLTALRDWLFIGLIAGVMVAAWISRVLGSTALVEMQEMGLSFSAASSRVIVMIGLIVFVCFHIRHAFDSKEIDVFLSRPISRSSLVFSYWLGFTFVALLLVLPTAFILSWGGILDTKGFWIWTFSLLLESCLVVAVALFSAFTLKSAVSSVIVSMGFYVLSRMMGFFMITTKSAFLFQTLWLNDFLSFVINTISIVIPRLDFYSNSEWLIYGIKHQEQIMQFSVQTLVFVPVLLIATMIDFKRRQF